MTSTSLNISRHDPSEVLEAAQSLLRAMLHERPAAGDHLGPMREVLIRSLTGAETAARVTELSSSSREELTRQLQELVSAIAVEDLGANRERGAELLNGFRNRTTASAPGPHEQVADGFTAKRAADIVGITYRQLDYWARTDLVQPEVRSTGSGPRRAYSYRNLLELRTVKNLLDAGIKLESVRNAFDYLRLELGTDPTDLNLVISGTETVLVRSGDEIIDLLRQGQGVLNVLPLGAVKAEVDAQIIDLYPEVDIARQAESDG